MIQHSESIDSGECGNCDCPVVIERRYENEEPFEEGYVCLNCGYENWEPVEDLQED